MQGFKEAVDRVWNDNSIFYKGEGMRTFLHDQIDLFPHKALVFVGHSLGQ